MKKLLLLALPLLLLAACGATTPNTATESDAAAMTQNEAAPVPVIDNDSNKQTTAAVEPVDAMEKTTPTTPAKTAENTQKITLAPVVINMESGNFFFKPAQISAKVGQAVTVNFTNAGFHDFTIDALGIDLNLNNVPTGKVTFTPTKAGSFEYYCSVGSHKSQGMKGTLVVTE